MADNGGHANGDGLRRFLLREMDRARLCQLPVAVALLRPEDAESQELVLRLALEQLRSFDFAEPLDAHRVVVVLSVTPLAAGERMVGAILRRVRQLTEAECVCSAGIVGYGGCAELTPEALLQSAEHALAKARSLGGNRLEVAPCADVELASRETLVRASEKHFLFTGKRLPEY
jgi:hypothetical protein